MERRAVSGIMLILLLISMLTLAFNIQPINAEPTTIIVPDDYPTIQEAINNANEEDTILVLSGTYYEHVVIDKAVSLIGENRSTTIIDGGGTGSVVRLWNTDKVHVAGFTIQNGYDGIFLEFSHRNIIENNTFQRNNCDIWVLASNGNTINNNMLRSSAWRYTLEVWDSTDNTVIDNIIYRGIILLYSGGNTLRNNSMTWFNIWGGPLTVYMNNVDTSNTVSGKPIYYWTNQHNKQVPEDAGSVIVVNSTDIVVKDLVFVYVGVVFAYTRNSLITNVISHRADEGITLDHCKNNTINGNDVAKNYQGIVLTRSENNIVSGNTVRSNYHVGLRLRESSGNDIRNNDVQHNRDGISLSSSSHNTIAENTITYNGFYVWGPRAGICFASSPYNMIYHNNFVTNRLQVYRPPNEWIPSINVWHDGYLSGGNYWSDQYHGDCADHYSEPDQNALGSDGIVDTPYVVDDINQDNYPLMKPWTPLPRTIGELKTKVEELGLEGLIDNQGVVKGLTAKLKNAERLVDKGKTEEAKTILAVEFIPQVHGLSGIHINVRAVYILIKSAEYILSQL